MSRFSVLFVAFLLTGAVAAETSDLIGDWSADCDAWGTPARCTLVWSQGLHASQLTVKYKIQSTADGVTIFSGEGVYRTTPENALVGYWHDSGGAIHPLAAEWRDGVLATQWGTAGSVQGRTRYRLTEAGKLEVTDWSLGENEWQRFMQVTYERS